MKKIGIILIIFVVLGIFMISTVSATNPEVIKKSCEDYNYTQAMKDFHFYHEKMVKVSGIVNITSEGVFLMVDGNSSQIINIFGSPTDTLNDGDNITVYGKGCVLLESYPYPEVMAEVIENN